MCGLKKARHDQIECKSGINKYIDTTGKVAISHIVELFESNKPLFQLL
jgi:hypothetical protein